MRHHVFVTDVESGATRDLTPGDFDSPPHFYEDGAIAFSPDSRELAFVSKRDGKDSEMWTTNHDVWSVPVSGGAARKLTSNPGADMTPVYSPDGRWIVVRAQRRAGFESDRWYLDAYDRASGARRTLFTTPDLSVDDFRFSPDGTTIWFIAVRNGRENLYTIPAAGGTPTLAVQGGAVTAFQPANGFAVFAKSSLVAPADLYRVGRDGTTQQLTNENAGWLSAAELPAPASMTVTGAAGAHDSILAAQAAELRRDEEVSRGLPHPRRAPGQLGGWLVDALESVALGGAGVGGGGAQPARLHRIRAEVRRRGLPGLVRQGDDRSRRRVRRRVARCPTSIARAPGSPAPAMAATP